MPAILAQRKDSSMRTLRTAALLTGFLLLLFWSFNCKDSITDNGANIVFPDSGVSYGRHVEPLFLSACAIPGCHTAADKDNSGGLSLETYQEATSVPLVIIPRDTVNSRLVWSLEGKNNTPRMPPVGRPGLTTNQINGLKRWILEGAQNN